VQLNTAQNIIRISTRLSEAVLQSFKVAFIDSGR